MCTHLLDYCGKDHLKKFVCDKEGKRYRVGHACLFIENKVLFLSVYVDDIKMFGKKQNVAPMWKKLMTSFLDLVYLGCTQRECTPNEIIIEQKKMMFESRMLG